MLTPYRPKLELRKKSWERPPLALKGEDHADKLYLSVGRAISRWETLESEMVKLFALLTNSHHMTSVHIFGSVVSSAGRIDLLKGANRAALINYPFRQKRMDRFLSHVRHHAGLRNDVAHGHAVQHNNQCYWVPAEYHASKTDAVFGSSGQIKFRYSAEQIDEMANTFMELWRSTMAVQFLLAQWLQTVPAETVPPHAENKRALYLQGYMKNMNRIGKDPLS